MQRYKVEPYVACADVYSDPPHVGRGGWTWYTGSAGWMYRVGPRMDSGLPPEGRDPCSSIPASQAHWPGFEIVFRTIRRRYEIAVENPHGVCRGIAATELDGMKLTGVDRATTAGRWRDAIARHGRGRKTPADRNWDEGAMSENIKPLAGEMPQALRSGRYLPN